MVDRPGPAMPNIFENFDFHLLDDPEFGEDSVREELINPLLKALGYSASPPYRIIRSKSLKHPYVYFGTVKKDITVIPDYLLERDGRYEWVLDAKAPDENIDTGKNVEQAYSYAMHRDVRVPLYALCNGRKLLVYHVNQEKPVIDVSLQEINENWLKILTILGCKSAWPGGLRPDFLPDFGLALTKAGLSEGADGKKFIQIFLALPIMVAAKAADNLYTFNAPIGPPLTDKGQGECLASFDFGPELYQQFLDQFEPRVSEAVKSALSRQPYKINFHKATSPELTFAAELGDQTFTNGNESYRPLIVTKFI
jgi:hypothetical protein